MPSSPRRDLIRDGEIATYHVWSRTAQQRYLMGFDQDSREDREYRRAWLVRLLAHQAKYFAVDVANFQPMGNHFHLIVRTRPDVAQRWSDEEVAWRWRMAWPKFHEERQDWYRNPTDSEIRKLLAKPEKLDEARKNLSSLSWFVARVKEPFSKLCNAEANTEGHFWAERFGSRELVDDAAVLACSMYVDVNQIKANMAASLAESAYSAIQARIIEGRRREAEEAMEAFLSREGKNLGISLTQLEEMYMSCAWIAPIRPDGALKLVNDIWQAYSAPDQPAAELPTLERTDTDEKLTSDLVEIPESDQPAANPVAIKDVLLGETSEKTPPTEVDENACLEGQCYENDDRFQGDNSAVVTDTLPRNLFNEDDASSRMTAMPAAQIDSARGIEGDESPAAADARSTVELSEKAKAQARRLRNQPTFEIHRRLLPRTPLRASDNPFLDMTLEQYLNLAEAAAERVMHSRDAPISELVASMLHSRGISSEAWHETLDGFDELFCHVAGAPRHVEAFAKRTGRQGVSGMDACRRVFLENAEWAC